MHATSITRAEKNSFDSQIAARRACDRDVVLLLHLPRCASRMINYEERVEESAAHKTTALTMLTWRGDPHEIAIRNGNSTTMYVL